MQNEIPPLTITLRANDQASAVIRAYLNLQQQVTQVAGQLTQATQQATQASQAHAGATQTAAQASQAHEAALARQFMALDRGASALHQMDAALKTVAVDQEGLNNAASKSSTVLSQQLAALDKSARALDQTDLALKQVEKSLGANAAGHESLNRHVAISLGLFGALPGPIGQVAGAFGALRIRLSETEEGVLALGIGAAVIGSQLMTGLGSAVDAARQYQRTMAEVQTVTDGSAESMARLSAKAMEIGVTTQFNSQQAAKGLYELGSAGLTATESLAAIKPVTDLAMLGNRELGATTKDVVNILRQFNIDASQTGKVVDIMALAVQGSTLHFNEIGEAYRNIAGRAHSMNVELPESTAAIMLMNNAGLTASMTGTALGTALDRLAKNTGEAAKGAAELGLRIYDSHGQFLGLSNLFHQLEDTLPRLTQQQQNHALSLLGGARASGLWRDVLQASQNVMKDGQEITLHGAQLFDYWADRAKHAGGTAEGMAAVIRQTLDFQIKNLEGSLGEASIMLGRTFIPALSAVVPQIMSMVNAWVLAPPAIHNTTGALLALTGATLAAGGTVLALGVAAAALGPALGLGLAAAAPLAAALGALAAVSAVVAVAMANDWLGVGTAGSQAFQTIGKDAKILFEYLQTHQGDVEAFLERTKKRLSETLPGAAAVFALGDMASAAHDAGVDVGNILLHALADSFPAAAVADIIGQALHHAATEVGRGQEADELIHAYAHRLAEVSANAQSDEELTAATQALVHAFAANFQKIFPELGAEGIQQAIKMLLAASQLDFDKLGEDAGLRVGQSLAMRIATGLEDHSEQSASALKKAIELQLATATSQLDLEGALRNVKAEKLLTAIIGDEKVSDQAKAQIIAVRNEVTQLTEGGGALRGVYAALHEAEDLKVIDGGKVIAILDGTGKYSEKAANAHELHRRAIEALIESGDKAQVMQGLWEQKVESFIHGALKDLPIGVAASILALENQNNEMGAAQVLADHYGISLRELLTDIDSGVSAHKRMADALKEEKKAAEEAAKALNSGFTANAEVVYSALTKNLDAATRGQLELIKVTQGLGPAAQAAFVKAGGSVEAYANLVMGKIEDVRKAAAAMAAGPQGGSVNRGLGGETTEKGFLRPSPVGEEFWRLGQSASAGVAAGIQDGAPQIQQALRISLQGAVAAGRDTIDARSPSRVFADEVGQPMGEGIAQGLESTAGLVKDTVTGLLRGAHAAAVQQIQKFPQAIGAFGAMSAEQIARQNATLGGTVPAGFLTANVPKGGPSVPDITGWTPGAIWNGAQWMAAPQQPAGWGTVRFGLNPAGPGVAAWTGYGALSGLPGGEPMLGATTGGSVSNAPQFVTNTANAYAASLGLTVPQNAPGQNGMFAASTAPAGGAGGGGGGGGGAFAGPGGASGFIAQTPSGATYFPPYNATYQAGSGFAQYQAAFSTQYPYHPDVYSPAQMEQLFDNAKAEVNLEAEREAQHWKAMIANATEMSKVVESNTKAMNSYTADALTAVNSLNTRILGDTQASGKGMQTGGFTGAATAEASLAWAQSQLGSATDDFARNYWQSVIDNLGNAFPGLIQTAAQAVQGANAQVMDLEARWGKEQAAAYKSQIDKFNASLLHSWSDGPQAMVGAIFPKYAGPVFVPGTSDQLGGLNVNAGPKLQVTVHQNTLFGAQDETTKRHAASQMADYLIPELRRRGIDL